MRRQAVEARRGGSDGYRDASFSLSHSEGETRPKVGDERGELVGESRAGRGEGLSARSIVVWRVCKAMRSERAEERRCIATDAPTRARTRVKTDGRKPRAQRVQCPRRVGSRPLAPTMSAARLDAEGDARVDVMYGEKGLG